MIPLDDIVKDVISDNDNIFINLVKKVDDRMAKLKKQIVQNKIKEKQGREK